MSEAGTVELTGFDVLIDDSMRYVPRGDAGLVGSFGGCTRVRVRLVAELSVCLCKTAVLSVYCVGVDRGCWK